MPAVRCALAVLPLLGDCAVGSGERGKGRGVAQLPLIALRAFHKLDVGHFRVEIDIYIVQHSVFTISVP